MAAGELDRDLGALLLAMAEEMALETPGASGMLRALQARYLDLYARLEDSGTADLLTHSRGVSQLVQLQRSIRLADIKELTHRPHRDSPFAAPARPRGQVPEVGAEGGEGSFTGVHASALSGHEHLDDAGEGDTGGDEGA